MQFPSCSGLTLAPTYVITVYATKAGCGDGEVGIGDIVNITNVMAGKTAGQGD